MKRITPGRRSVPMLMAVAAGLPGAAAGVASGQTLTWQNAAGGAASTAGNWSPAQVPGAANALVWNLASTYGVTFVATTGSSLGHTYRRGTVSLTMTSAHTAGTGGIVVGDLNGDNATATLSSGVWNSAGNVVVGDAAGSIGRLNVSSTTADLATTGTGRLIVGNDGNGTLSVSNLGSVVVVDRLIVADGAGAVGAVTITGGQSAPPFGHSTLTVSGTGESRIGASGDATMSVLSGGTATFAGDLTVGALLGSDSSLTIDGAALPITSVSVAGNLNVARNTTRLTQAGNGQVTLRGSGRLEVGGTLNIENDPDGEAANGEVLVDGAGARVQCRSILIGGAGNLLIDKGEVRVSGGAFSQTLATYSLRGSAPDTLASLVLTDGATMNCVALAIGTLGRAQLRFESGSVLPACDSIGTGLDAAARGEIVVTGAGTNVTTEGLRIGLRGTGSLLVEQGGVVAAGRITAGEQSSGGASIEVRGAEVRCGGDFILGGRSEGGILMPGGASSLIVDAQGVIDLTGNFYRFGSSSFDLEGGTINANEFHTAVFNFGLPIEARGVINAKLRGELARITATGPLTLGDGSDDAVRDLGIDVGSHRVQCLGQQSPIGLRSTTMAGGRLETSSFFELGSGETLSGHGRIQGVVRSLGQVTSSGGTLTFVDGLNSELGEMDGESFEFLPGGTFRGFAGGARWRLHPGTRSLFKTVGDRDIQLGSAVADAFVCEGELILVDDTIIIDSDGIESGPKLTIGNTRLEVRTSNLGARADVRVKSRGGVRDLVCGNGVIFAASVENGGTLSPGLDDGADIGVIAVEGDLEQACEGVPGEMVLDVTGPELELVDRVLVNGTLTLDGTVSVRVAPGFQPDNGFSMTVVGADSIVGAFDRVEIPPGWSLERTVQLLSVVFCAPDFNSDGFVDFFDYLEFAACFEGEFCAPGSSADFNGDGFVDFFDYDDFVRAFELGC